MKVWILTKGEYSDYRVVGVFSSLEMANKFKEAYSSSRDESFSWDSFNEPFDTELDCFIDQGLLSYWVRLEYESGNVDEAELDDCSSKTGEVLERVWEIRGKKYFAITCLAKDQIHAIKIANEKRLIHKAQNGE